MTNKQFEQIEYLSKKLWEDINNGSDYSMVTYTEFLGIVTEVWEKLQKEPVSNVWHDKSENIKEGARVCVLWNDGIITSGEWKDMDENPADIKTLKMWAYESDILPTEKQK